MPRPTRSRSHSSDSNNGGRKVKRTSNRSRKRLASRGRSTDRVQRKSRGRSRSRSYRDDSIKLALSSIISRLSAIEENSSGVSRTPPRPQNTPQENNDASAGSKTLSDLLSAITVAKSQSYFVSNFDPSSNDIEVWCEEVDRAKLTNGWGDAECLSRISNCLKGDAKSWLDEWVTHDRSWSNFKLEFTPLCPRRLDYANILFEAINTTSDKYATYAEYARRLLLRLRIVKGLSSELIVQIIIRGITDPQVRAAAVNSDLTVDNLVSFLAIYLKPSRSKVEVRTPSDAIKTHKSEMKTIKCYTCGRAGHKSNLCRKRTTKEFRTQPGNVTTPSVSKIPTCNFCRKLGHTESECFTKQRADARNDNQRKKVNLCKENSSSSRASDIATAVIQGVSVDVLIDSGALNISLISSEVVKLFSCHRKSTQCVIKGVGANEISSNEYVTLTIEFENISLDVDLVIVPDSCINTPIIIGTDVLNRDGIVYLRTKDKQYLTHSSSNVFNANIIQTSLKPNDINTPLQGSDLASLMSVVNDFAKFLISGTATTTVKTGKMHINLTSDSPIVYHPYRLSYQERVKVREIIKDLLDKGIVRESQSEYASPILLVKKKDGSNRLCVDYRALNRITVRDRYPLPLIEDHIDRLGTSKFFSCLDMASGFYQIPIHESSIHKTGFVTPEGHYEFIKMPFGLCNSPTVYQRIINTTLRKLIEAGSVLVYVDDVLLMSETITEGITLLREVFKTLTDAGFSINLQKCSFLTSQVEYLGRVISHGQVRPSPGKVAALVSSPAPSNVKQVRQFLGLAGYFRRYIEGYASKTVSISRLLKKDTKFVWGSEQEFARQYLINRLTTEPVLAIFDPALATELHTDASSVGYGAVLLQTHSDGKKRVVTYFSKTTQGAECRYHSYELETLAVVRALQHLRHYLIGIKFKIITDCNALKATERKKDLLPRVARWWMYLQDYNFSIEYRKGVLMPHADYLSRNPPVTRVNHIDRPRNWAQIAQSSDSETQGLIQKLNEGDLDSRRYVCQNGLLYYRYTPVGEEPRLLCFIPKGHRLSLLRIFHDEHEHIGVEKTLHLILKHFWFPGLKTFVNKYVSHCLACVSKKRVPRAPQQPISSWEKPDVPFTVVHIDSLGPLPESNGYKFVLVIVDSYSKFSLLYPLYRQDANDLKRVFNNAISLFGVPKLLVCDRGRMFEASSFVKLVSDMGCDLHYITPEMHHANGQAERYIRTVLNMIRIEVSNKNTSWSSYLWKIQLILNITKQKTTQYSALNLLIGTDATTPILRALIRDVAIEDSHPNRQAWRELCRNRASERLKKNRLQQDSHINRHRSSPRVFKVKDLVFVIKYSQSTGKLDSGMRGPYQVTKVLTSDRYELELLSGSRGQKTQAAAQYMVPWKGEWCPDTCASFFDCE